jgi:hypothetical protein
MRDEEARLAIDALAREMATLLSMIKVPAMFDEGNFRQVSVSLNAICERLGTPEGLRRVNSRVVELELLAQKLLAYCDGAQHRDAQYHDEREQLIEIARGGTGRGS